jgi:hypothetical protein
MVSKSKHQFARLPAAALTCPSVMAPTPSTYLKEQERSLTRRLASLPEDHADRASVSQRLAAVKADRAILARHNGLIAQEKLSSTRHHSVFHYERQKAKRLLLSANLALKQVPAGENDSAARKQITEARAALQYVEYFPRYEPKYISYFLTPSDPTAIELRTRMTEVARRRATDMPALEADPTTPEHALAQGRALLARVTEQLAIIKAAANKKKSAAKLALLSNDVRPASAREEDSEATKAPKTLPRVKPSALALVARAARGETAEEESSSSASGPSSEDAEMDGPGAPSGSESSESSESNESSESSGSSESTDDVAPDAAMDDDEIGVDDDVFADPFFVDAAGARRVARQQQRARRSARETAEAEAKQKKRDRSLKRREAKAQREQEAIDAAAAAATTTAVKAAPVASVVRLVAVETAPAVSKPPTSKGTKPKSGRKGSKPSSKTTAKGVRPASQKDGKATKGSSAGPAQKVGGKKKQEA